jgi:glycerophosphoryl diester phosphodiesterase
VRTGDDSNRELLPPTNLVERAHRHGLLVHPYTFRNEATRLAADYGGNPVEEDLQFYRLGVDGVFSRFTGWTTRVAQPSPGCHRTATNRG